MYNVVIHYTLYRFLFVRNVRCIGTSFSRYSERTIKSVRKNIQNSADEELNDHGFNAIISLISLHFVPNIQSFAFESILYSVLLQFNCKVSKLYLFQWVLDRSNMILSYSFFAFRMKFNLLHLTNAKQHCALQSIRIISHDSK